MALAADWAPAAQRGSAIATAGMFLELGISGGATLGGLIGQAAGLSTNFLVLGACPAIALVVVLVTPWGRRTMRAPVAVAAGVEPAVGSGP
jgi:predicted MFS family arabinose efflux permease